MQFLEFPGTKKGSLKIKPEVQLELPAFEKTAAEISKSAENLIRDGKAWIEKLRELKDTELSFESSFGFLDDLENEESKIISRIYFLQNVHPEADVREAARKAQLNYQSWAIERAFDEKLYDRLRTYADKNETLEGEDKKLVEEQMRDYRRLGMELPKEQRDQLQDLKKKLSEVETQFSSNIIEHSDFVNAKPDQLKGLDASFIEGLEKQADGSLKISLDYPEFFPVMEHCSDESLRKTLLTRKYRAAAEKNSGLLKEMVELRSQISKILGYKSWNHYIIEERMAKEPEKVISFLHELKSRLGPKIEEELETLRKLKAEDTSNPNARVEMWDFYYLSSLLKKKNFQINSQELKKYFSLPDVLSGMFELTSCLFGIKIKEKAEGSYYQWHPEVKLYQVDDESGAPIGFFYLDLHPRSGKYNHAAAFGLVDGKLLKNGRYQAPVSAMVCNFPRGGKDTPALITHGDVETLFHEFGHVLHNILTTAKFCRFAGTSVARDFVEAPSQIMENWAWESEGLKIISKHFETGEKLPDELIQRLNRSKRVGLALFYIRQISLALADLEIHGSSVKKDPVEEANRVMSEVFLPMPENTSFAASWGHMTGYASGYYGYAWADVMAADLFSRFKTTQIIDPKLGRKLRKEIYEPGSSRDENDSLEAFLERPLSSQAFFKDLGVSRNV